MRIIPSGALAGAAIRNAVLAVATSLLLAGCNGEKQEATVVAPPADTRAIAQVVAFGDSLSDGGTYNPTTADANPDNDLPTGLIFSTKPGMTWAANVAVNYGRPISPNRQVNFGVVGSGGAVIELSGLNYAEGGAMIETDAPDGGVVMQTIPGVGTVPVQLATSRSIRSQIDAYLEQHGGFNDNQLVLIQGGANDLFSFLRQVADDPSIAADPRNVQSIVAITATAMINQISRLRSAGANRIIYSTLPDLGLTPQFRTTPLATLASQISVGYNAMVENALNGLGGVNVFDALSLIQQVADDPERFGFTNVTTPACTSTTTPGDPSTLSALICSPTTLVEPGADVGYLFADGVHPTARAHALWADQVTAAFPNP
jgi:outer membrane lipase/esterase